MSNHTYYSRWEYMKELDRLRAEIEHLQAALREYGKHHYNCKHWDTEGLATANDLDPARCDCGFVEALLKGKMDDERLP